MNGWEGAKRRSRQALTSRRDGGVATRRAPEWVGAGVSPSLPTAAGRGFLVLSY